MSFLTQRYILLPVLLFVHMALVAQPTPYLERKVSISVINRSIGEVFRQISEQTSVVFSYSQAFDDQRKITLRCSNRPLRLVMAELLKESTCTYKIKDRFIILKCGPKPETPPSVITGYIYNAEDSSAVPNASIYIRQSRHSAQSNTYGFFSLSFPGQLPRLALSVARENYVDSTVVINHKQKQEVIIYLYPRIHARDTIVQTLPAPKPDSVFLLTRHDTLLVPQRRFFSNFWKPFKAANTNLRNISDTLFSDVALSLLPQVGTNRLLSINTVNHVAINVLAGYSKGIRGFELGGLANIDHGDVRYAQVAGIANVVSGHSTGAQVSGILNFNAQSTSGAQLSGIANVDRGYVRGAQVAGIGNVTSQRVNGVQVGGIFNVSGQRTRGVQLAGIVNATDTLYGIQVAGIVNVSRHCGRGMQLAGIANTADTLYGIQVAGIVNRAGYLKGLQLGLVNIADSSSGVSIGIFNYIRTGYHKLEVSTDELLFAYLSFATGTEHFHTSFSAGYNYGTPNLLSYGLSVGSCLSIGKRFGLCADAGLLQILDLRDNISVNNLLGRGYFGPEYRIHPKFRIGLGPTFNIYSASLDGVPSPDPITGLRESYRYMAQSSDPRLKTWLGLKLVLKFF